MSYKVIVKPFRQSPELCGPGSLKIALSAFNKTASEAELAKLSGALQAAGRGSGTEHKGMIAAATALGMHVFAKDEGTVEELRYLIETEHVPVIVGWFDRDEDHYSVMVEIADDTIVLADSGSEGPERTIPKDFFKMVWFDFVGSHNKEVSWGWYMVVSFEKLSADRFKVPDGNYH